MRPALYSTRIVLAFALILTFAARAGAAVEPRQIKTGVFTVEFWPGDEQIARDSLETLQQTLSDFAQRLPGGGQPITVTICRSVQEFRRRAGQYGRTWVGGVTRTPSGQIAVKAPYLLPQPGDYDGLLRHELLHVLLARNVQDEFLPRWLNEGIVMVLSKENRWGSMARLARMYASGRLIPYYNLDFAFLPLGDEVLSGDAYAEALSLTRFLIDRLGEKGFWNVVRAMRQEPFETALLQATGLKPGPFYNAWRDSMRVPAIIITAASAVSVFNIMAFIVILAWVHKRRRNLAILQQWDEEEWAEAGWQNEYVSPEPWAEEQEED
ncbi:MAG: hypothetical protein NTZ09_11875 [Candidatus Hydrogenedentes bacterium]|nr:hypothetical protein [Candidatus Hydrogenedentota bacterium]